MIVSGSKDQSIRIWDALTGSKLNILYGHEDIINSVSFSRNDNMIVSGSFDNTIRIWDVCSGKEINKCNHFEAINSV